jgi:hypothetical protein
MCDGARLGQGLDRPKAAIDENQYTYITRAERAPRGIGVDDSLFIQDTNLNLSKVDAKMRKMPLNA